MRTLALTFATLLVLGAMPDARVCGCSMDWRFPTSLDPGTVVATGEVVDFIEPLSVREPSMHDGGVVTKGWGLRLRVVARVNGLAANDSLDVYFEAACYELVYSREGIAQAHPKGTRLRIISYYAIRSRSETSLGAQPIVVVTRDRPFHMSIETGSPWATSETMVCNYERILASYMRLENPEVEPRSKFIELSQAMYFELHKDLARLRRATTQEEVDDILGRLAFYPDAHFPFEVTLKTYARDPDFGRRLIAKRWDWINASPSRTVEDDDPERILARAESDLHRDEHELDFVRLPPNAVVTLGRLELGTEPESNGSRLLREIQRRLSLQGRLEVDAGGKRFVVEDWEERTDEIGKLVDEAERETENLDTPPE